MGKRVLIIDDNADGCLALKMLLEMDGHTVEHALDGASGLQAAARLQPQVVLCDLMLPDMSGLDVIRAVGDGVLKIAITGRNRDEVWPRCEAAGFADLLRKPIDFDALSQLLR